MSAFRNFVSQRNRSSFGRDAAAIAALQIGIFDVLAQERDSFSIRFIGIGNTIVEERSPTMFCSAVR